MAPKKPEATSPNAWVSRQPEKLLMARTPMLKPAWHKYSGR